MEVDRRLMKRARINPEFVRELFQIARKTYIEREEVRTIIMEKVRVSGEEDLWNWFPVGTWAIGGAAGYAVGGTVGLVSGAMTGTLYGVVFFDRRYKRKENAQRRYVEALEDSLRNTGQGRFLGLNGWEGLHIN